MLESRGITIELFRVGFRDQGLHVLVQRRSRIRGQDLIEGQRASQIHRIFDRGAYALNRVCKKPKNVEALSRDPFGTAVCHDLTLMLRRNWPAPHFFSVAGSKASTPNVTVARPARCSRSIRSLSRSSSRVSHSNRTGRPLRMIPSAMAMLRSLSFVKRGSRKIRYA